MPSSSVPTPESVLIEAYVRSVADVQELRCGERIEGGYEVIFKPTPSSDVEMFTIERDQFNGGDWKRKVRDFLHKVGALRT